MSKELEDRFFNYAKHVRDFCQKLKWNTINLVYIRQLVRSSSSIDANYLEASDDIGKSDERMKIKIARREAKETNYWLQLLITYNDPELEKEKLVLIEEGNQIRKILSSIVSKLVG
ncbi:four helix bundle protein [Niastella caeni]|uniref:Four helix bundle protein n=1 Tax=Niastella caeni TaxID=2569763 RepID=A0A4S8HM11_9BACT|nr:four helix bundle protein [Niastella caeni]THU34814.1 four helix bundle protein [Niastella caeni]